MPLIVNQDSENIWKFASLSVGDFYLFDTSLYIRWTERRGLLEGGNMLESLQVKHSKHAIGTSTVEIIIDRIKRAAECPANLDIHPFWQLSFFWVDVDVPVVSESVHQVGAAANPYEYFVLDLAKVDGEWLYNLRAGSLSLDLLHFFGIFVEVPKLEVRVPGSHKISLVWLFLNI